MTGFYLRQNVVLEPLYNQWYAWSFLLAPATAPMFVAHHVKVMQSFVSAPEVHATAMKNPAMLGGPFINYEADKVGAVRELLERTRAEQAPLLGFAEAVRELDALLANEGTGFSLEPLYPKIPKILRGYVELTYDLRHRATARFIEGLLYRSPYYRERSQSIALWKTQSDDRPFVFSTPRLEEQGRIHVEVPFGHERLDELMRMREIPAPFGRVKELLGTRDADDDLLKSFLTEEAPAPAARFSGDGVRVRYFGHACVLIETRDVSILTDPVISYVYPSSKLPRYTFADLPERIDYVVITHPHADHLMFETLLQLRPKIGTIIVPKNNGGGLQDPSIKLMLKSIGFRSVVEIDETESIPIPGGEIIGVPFLGEHSDLAIRSKIAHLVRLGGRSILLGADSNALEPRLYELVQAAVGDIDILFLGMECEGAPMSWIYGPLFTIPLVRKMDQSRRLDGSNSERAKAIVELLKPKQVYIYAMGQEPWLNHVMALKYTDESPQIVESNKLIDFCRSRGIVAERPFCQKELLL